MTARQYRVNVIDGICLENHRIICEYGQRIDEYTISLFLLKLRQKHPSPYKVHIIWDNAGYHRSRQVKGFAKTLGIELHYLPAYSPNLNPIERLWKIMHEHVTYNRYYPTFLDFQKSIKRFFQHVGKRKALLRSRMNDNFQILGLPNFAP